MIIHCQIGNHDYEIPSRRGRPPLNCDLHKPIKQDIKITSSSAQTSPEKSTSVFDLVPGLQELVQKSNMKTYICQYGDTHEFQQESRRGRPPRFCPEHREQALISANSQPKVISPEKKEEAKKKLEEAIQYHISRVVTAEEADETAYAQLSTMSRESSRWGFNNDESIFNNWIRKNSVLLNEIISLRSNESKLAAL
jgi:hypothetical protein